MRFDFQVGTSVKAHKILGKFAGRVDDEESESKSKKVNPKAPFEKMSDAYLFALMLGLSRGKKMEIKKHINYANFSSIEKDIDIATLMRLLGDPKDMESKESAKKAIEEYATWGLMYMDEHLTINLDDYRFSKLFE